MSEIIDFMPCPLGGGRYDGINDNGDVVPIHYSEVPQGLFGDMRDGWDRTKKVLAKKALEDNAHRNVDKIVTTCGECGVSLRCNEVCRCGQVSVGPRGGVRRYY